MKKTVLVTGANGFIATQIVRYLLANMDVTVLALVRANDAEKGVSKVEREWWDWPELIADIGRRIQVVCGDVCSIRLA
jgi:long-chain acyl-CoA synthetase